MAKKYYRLHGISIAEYQNNHVPGGYFYKITKSYRDKNGNWAYTEYFTLRDLLVISAIVQKIADFSGDVKEVEKSKDDEWVLEKEIQDFQEEL